jgi:hypothetical protein
MSGKRSSREGGERMKMTGEIVQDRGKRRYGGRKVQEEGEGMSKDNGKKLTIREGG